eukprot:TRINITY_DN1882_c0_g1_i2.p2 TRINITY_DN1882_c0_g1~~TRINITY_DN1882_c0_g1_i2.p2  ORF type:complete len:207 (+),score=27.09 TRINITY_DN1882_c0_g1_i2:917-1537(+)
MTNSSFENMLHDMEDQVKSLLDWCIDAREEQMLSESLFIQRVGKIQYYVVQMQVVAISDLYLPLRNTHPEEYEERTKRLHDRLLRAREAVAWIVQKANTKLRAAAQELALLFTSLDKCISTKAGLTLAEKKAIFEAMSKDVGSNNNLAFGGHWYSCPNGHTYTIGECGGAMEESTCPECGSRIGGSDHSLVAGNGRATEFLNDLGQ